MRKRLSVVSANAKNERTLITKGALENVLKICTQRTGRGGKPCRWMTTALAGIEQRYSDWSDKGFRVLGVAIKSLDGARDIVFAQPTKMVSPSSAFCSSSIHRSPMCEKAIVDLAQRGVQLKIITGDNEKVARHVAEAVHLPIESMLTGSALNGMS